MTAVSETNTFKVVIAGGGVAALEAAMALREFAGPRVSVQLVAPNAEFSYRPMSVREPFAYAPADKYPLAEIAAEIGAELIVDEFAWVDTKASRPYRQRPRARRMTRSCSRSAHARGHPSGTA
jgi:NADH dehydrogenase FAD-containing subunit